MSSHPLVWHIGYISSLEYGGTLGYFSRHLVVTLNKIDMLVSKQHVSKYFLWWEASKCTRIARSLKSPTFRKHQVVSINKRLFVLQSVDHSVVPCVVSSMFHISSHARFSHGRHSLHAPTYPPCHSVHEAIHKSH